MPCMLVVIAFEMKSLFLVLDSSSRLFGCLYWPTVTEVSPLNLYCTLASRNLSERAS